MKNMSEICRQIFLAGLQASSPETAVREHSESIRVLYQEGGFRRLLLVGFGKAAPAMAGALHRELGRIIDSGIVVTKYGHATSPLPKRIQVLEAGHPVPDANSLRAAETILHFVSDAGADDLIVTLISGGGSALLTLPQEGTSLADKQQTTSLLLKAGADIFELNTVRKHLSRIKGGHLAEAAFPARVVSLILSDVIGDRLDVIASGPTAPDPSTYNDALSVLDRYRLIEQVPITVIELLRRGAQGEFTETPKAGSHFLHNVDNRIIGSNRQALAAAAQAARDLGFQVVILADDQTGEAREVGRALADRAVAAAEDCGKDHRLCLLAGGETTVTVCGQGKGGRNMELALAFAMAVEGSRNLTLLSAGTDGTDGPTDAAGAIADGATLSKARKLGLDPEEFLADNNSYEFFKRIGGLLVTGPTGTNVMDIQVILIEAAS